MGEYFRDKMTRRDFLKSTAHLCVKIGLGSILVHSCTPEITPEATTPAPTPTPIPTKSIPVDSGFEPAYLKLHRTGELKKRVEELWYVMESCQLCPRRCRVNRLEGMSGFCQAPGTTLVVASAHPHFGEEMPLVGKGGSGTIFLSHCNLRCVFCQNYEISQLGRGYESTTEGLASMMLRLQELGCHNINLVTPTHYSAPILKALDRAAEIGLRLPIVYNTSGWERLEILAYLDGIVDIYLPDIKYWDSAMSAKYSSGADSYPEMAKAAILEMHRQVGVANPARDGIIQRGLMIRHLVMPNNTGGSEEIMSWIATNLPKDTYVNIMAQYNPHYKAYDYPEISRRITVEEYQKVVNKAQAMGLMNIDVQGYWLFQK